MSGFVCSGSLSSLIAMNGFVSSITEASYGFIKILMRAHSRVGVIIRWVFVVEVVVVAVVRVAWCYCYSLTLYSMMSCCYYCYYWDYHYCPPPTATTSSSQSPTVGYVLAIITWNSLTSTTPLCPPTSSSPPSTN